MVRGNFFRIAFGGEIRAGVCAVARDALHLTFSNFSFFGEGEEVLTVVGLFFFVSAEAGVGKAKKDRKSSVVTNTDFVFITLFTSLFTSLSLLLFPFDCRWWFRSYIENYSINLAYLISDAI